MYTLNATTIPIYPVLPYWVIIYSICSILSILVALRLFHSTNFHTAKSFELTCTSHPSEPGLIEVTCNSTRVVESLTCSIDDKVPEVCKCYNILHCRYNKPHLVGGNTPTNSGC